MIPLLAPPRHPDTNDKIKRKVPFVVAVSKLPSDLQSMMYMRRHGFALNVVGDVVVVAMFGFPFVSEAEMA